jgi:tetratricopeptide (TPR) repeat protein
MTPSLLQKSVYTIIIILFTNLSFAQSENYKTAYAAYKDGDSNKALEYFEKDVSENPNSAYSHFYLSVLYAIQEKYDLANEHINKSILNFPETSITMRSKSYAVKGDIEYKLKNFENTFENYALAIQLRPKEIDLYLDRGQYYFELGQLDKAKADFKYILSIDATNIYAYAGLGRNYLTEKKYELAEKNLTTAIQLNKLYYDAFKYRAQTYFEQNKFKEAILDILEVISIEPEDSDNRDLFLTYSLNDYEFALTELNEKSKDAPFNEYWNTTRARLYSKHGKYAAAIKEYNQLIKYLGTENKLDDLIYERATTYDNAGLYEKAIQDYDYLITKNSIEPIYYSQRANAYRYAGNYQKAILDLKKAIELDPKDNWNFYMRGWIYVEMVKETKKALQDFDKAVSLDPEYTYTYLMRGRLLLEKLHKKEKAIEDFNAILNLETEVKEDGNCKQYALFHLNKNQEAIQWMNEILKKYPSEGNYYDATCLYALMNNKEESINALKISFEKGNTNFKHISIDDDLDNVRNSPEFIALYNEWFEKYKAENNL